MAAVAYVRPLTPLGFEQPTGRDLLFWRNRLELDAASERRQTWLCLATGLTLNAVVFGISMFAARFFQRFRPPEATPISFKQACAAAAIACGVMFFLAAITKPAGRADCARSFVEGHHSSSSAGPESLVILVVLLIALYGSFCIVETITRLWLQLRLRRTDPDELARLMATISHAPSGIRLAGLRKHGQNETTLRKTIAILILTGWVKPDGDHLIQRSAAMRSCLRRHPLADVFQPGE